MQRKKALKMEVSFLSLQQFLCREVVCIEEWKREIVSLWRRRKRLHFSARNVVMNLQNGWASAQAVSSGIQWWKNWWEGVIPPLESENYQESG